MGGSASSTIPQALPSGFGKRNKCPCRPEEKRRQDASNRNPNGDADHLRLERVAENRECSVSSSIGGKGFAVPASHDDERFVELELESFRHLPILFTRGSRRSSRGIPGRSFRADEFMARCSPARPGTNTGPAEALGSPRARHRTRPTAAPSAKGCDGKTTPANHCRVL